MPERRTEARAPLTPQDALDAGVPEEAAARVADLSALAEAAHAGAAGPPPLSDPLMLLRFLNAREGDVEAAARMYRETVAWRAQFSIARVMASFGEGATYHADGELQLGSSQWAWRPQTPEAQRLARLAEFRRLPSLGPMGEPLLLWSVSDTDFAGIAQEGLEQVLLEAWVAHLEDVLQAARAASLRHRRLVQARLVLDAGGLGLLDLKLLPMARNLIALGKSYFPEVTSSVTVVRAPFLVERLFGAVRPCLTPVMDRKVAIFGDDFAEGLRRHAGVEMALLPTYLGGALGGGGRCG